MRLYKTELILSGGMKLTFEVEASNVHEAYMKMVEELKESGKERLLKTGSRSIKIEVVKVGLEV